MMIGEPTMAKTTKIHDFPMYRGNKTNNGCATKIEAVKKTDEEGQERIYMFWIGAKQNGTNKDGHATFGWTDKNNTVNIKLGQIDVGEILAVINGKKGHVGREANKGLFHQNPKGNSTLTFSFDEAKQAYNVRLSAKRDNNLCAISHSISLAEGEILRVILSSVVSKL